MCAVSHLEPQPWAVSSSHQLSSKPLQCLVLSITPYSIALWRNSPEGRCGAICLSRCWCTQCSVKCQLSVCKFLSDTRQNVFSSKDGRSSNCSRTGSASLYPSVMIASWHVSLEPLPVHVAVNTCLLAVCAWLKLSACNWTLSCVVLSKLDREHMSLHKHTQWLCSKVAVHAVWRPSACLNAAIIG